MTEKQKKALETIIDKLPESYREVFREIAEYAISLKYYPRLNTKETYADFVKNKHKKTILKIDTITNPPRLAVRFDALPICYGIFKEAVENRAKKCGTYNHCVNCNDTFGKKYILPDGRDCVICNAVIDIPSFGFENIMEVKSVIKKQDDFLMSLIVK